MDLILDPPDHMEPVERWEEWLADLRTLPPDVEGVAWEIACAEKWIPRRIELEELQQAQKGGQAA